MKKLKSLIPYPAIVQVISDDYFNFSLSKCSFEAQASFIALFRQELTKVPQVRQDSKEWQVAILPSSGASLESYKLVIEDSRIRLEVASETGLFYGLQTLKQLLYFHQGRLFPLIIEDYPAYAWRGIHLDVSRHFFPIEEIFVLLERMAELKLNRFHWHLSDDQGWRIESFKYPKLTTIASVRTEQDGSLYGGFYSQEEIIQVVNFAQEKKIMVIPEIDLPGHTQAILAAYPELSCSLETCQVWNEWGVSQQILSASKPQVYSFLEELLEEIIPLFPAPYFHIGGDECPTSQWENCPSCTKLMEEKGYNSYRDLQAEITNFLDNLLKKHNKRLIGWDEIADSTCPADSILMCWRGDAKDAVAKANRQGLNYILTPNHPYYLDWKQSHNPDEMGAFGVSSLADIYNYDYPALHSDKMLGMQANIWTERIETLTKLEYMAFPRIIALAENCWTPHKNKDYNRFLIYLKRFLSYYDQLYINYSTSNLDNNNKFIKEELITREDICSDLPQLTDVSSVFNPGAIRIDDKFYLLMRVQNRGRESLLVRAESDNGKDFTIDNEPLMLTGLDKVKSIIYHIYDPRLTYLDNKILVMTAIDTSDGCFLGLFTTEDLKSLNFQGLVSDADVRNGVIFPEKINGRFARLERPNKRVLQNGTKTGSSIYLSYSDDLLKWDNQQLVMTGNPHYWDELIGSGPIPIKTRYGWLHIYHGVATHFASSNIYQAGFSFLDLENPAKVIFRSKYNFLEPRESYECVGQVPNVVFPTGLIALDYDNQGFVNDDSDLFLYYGAADTSIGFVETNLRFFIEKMLIEQGV